MINKIMPMLSGFTLASALLLQPAMAASTKDEVLALKEQVKALQESQDAIQKDLVEIKKLLEAGARPAGQRPTAPTFEPQDISFVGAPVMGKADAPVTLIEYSDYQCPFCKRHYLNTMPSLKENYIDTGKVKFIMREFPLTSIHPRAMAASMAALCAKDQGKYWEMHNILFDNQRALSDDDLKSYGETIGLALDTFVACLDSAKYQPQVESDLKEGQAMGISGTPSFAVGLTNATDSDTVNVTKVIRGAQSFDAFEREIEALLSGGEAEAAGTP